MERVECVHRGDAESRRWQVGFKLGGDCEGVYYLHFFTRAKGENLERILCRDMVVKGILGIFRLRRRMRSDFAQKRILSLGLCRFASATLRPAAERCVFSFCLPSVYPSSALRNSGTHWAILSRAYGALSISSPEDCVRCKFWRRSKLRLYVEFLALFGCDLCRPVH